jgi:Cu+-exporting ATPase
MNDTEHNSENNEKRFTFGIEGMTCASCVRIVERSLKKMDGVHFVSINLGTEKGYVITGPDISFEDIKKRIDSTGYKGLQNVPDAEKVEKDFKAAKWRMIVSLIFMIPLTVGMIFHMSGFHLPWFIAVEFAAGAVVLFWPGRFIFKGAYIAAVHAHANMDTLVATGALASWITSFLFLVGIDISSFGSLSVMLVSIHLTGRYIESRLKYSASGEIRALLAMRPKEASILMNGEIVKAPAESIPVGAFLVVRSGESIALDGIITEGNGYIDESMITGEAERVFRKSGEEVTGGTILEQGSLKVEVLRAGDDTFMARMIKLVEDAQSSSVPIQAFADRVTGVFVPVIFLIAIIAGLIWGLNYDVMRGILVYLSQYIPWVNPDAGALSTGVFIFIAVLVIACPCALGLATPMALIAGSGLAARNGLLIKNGEAIQKAGEIKTIFFDKTGTITEGKPAVAGTSLDEKTLGIVLALENVSIHPIAESVKKYCFEKNITADDGVTDIEERAGTGVFGLLNGEMVSVESPENPELYSSLMDAGETVFEFKKAGVLQGYISVSDPVKSDSAAAVSLIKSLGIVPVMLTGDSERTALAVAAKIGIDRVISRVRPEQKLFAVQDEQKKGNMVCMVGDGINDAAALKAADIGIALGTGTDLSIESADIIITGGRLSSVPAAINISKITFKKIRQNLFWAFFYNIVAIPAAFIGVLHPAIAELCMILSSINVILNSISIKNIKIGDS